jgi:carboxylate-amine ligase
LFTEENKWRATRDGLDAQLYDFSTGEQSAARDVACDLVSSLRPISQELGCEAELEGVLEIAQNGTGAEKQRAVFAERNSTKDVARYLVASTAEA